MMNTLNSMIDIFRHEILRGKKTPSFKRIYLIAKALNIEVHKLFKSSNQI